MEWVETVGATLDEARERALDQLGVAEDEAEFEILEEPRAGLFGRTRGNARVRARVRPTQPRPKVDRRGRRVRSSGTSADEGGSEASEVEAPMDDAELAQPKRRKSSRRTGGKVVSHVGDSSGERLKEGRSRARGGHVEMSRAGGAQAGGEAEALGSGGTSSQEQHMNTESPGQSVPIQQVADEAERFLEGLLTAFGVEGSVQCAIEGDEIDLQVNGAELGLLVGPRGSTLVAVQELTRLASQRRLGDQESRLRVDVAGYRERRRVALAAFATKMADEVVASGAARVLEPMSSPDRKVVHDTLAVRDDVVTRSEGDDPFRRVVISPAS
jgi:spoIIIJ-associated protein